MRLVSVSLALTLTLTLSLALASGVVCLEPGRNRRGDYKLSETYYIEVPAQERTLAPPGDRGSSAVVIANRFMRELGIASVCGGHLLCVGHG